MKSLVSQKRKKREKKPRTRPKEEVLDIVATSSSVCQQLSEHMDVFWKRDSLCESSRGDQGIARYYRNGQRFVFVIGSSLNSSVHNLETWSVWIILPSLRSVTHLQIIVIFLNCRPVGRAGLKVLTDRKKKSFRMLSKQTRRIEREKKRPPVLAKLKSAWWHIYLFIFFLHTSESSYCSSSSTTIHFFFFSQQPSWPEILW